MTRHFVYHHQGLLQYITRVLESCDVPEDEAITAAEIILAADLRGIGSHGITRLFTYYVDKIRKGIISPKAHLSVLRESSAILSLDGNNGLGQVIGHKAMRMCIEKAKKAGVGFATVNRSNHYGIAGYYAMMALTENMIGISLTNSQPLVAPTYGRKAIIGTNPIAVAVPSGKYRPFVLDMATSVVSIGKIALYEKAEHNIPPGWGIDAEGDVTTSPSEVRQGGALLPLGGIDIMRGYKGYGLAMVVDILSGVLSGASFGNRVGKLSDKNGGSNVGHFFGAIQIQSFRALDAFLSDMENLLQEIQESPKSPGQTRIYIHGEKEFDLEEIYRLEGVPILSETIDSLIVSGNQINVPFDLEPIQEIDIPL